MRNNSKVIEDIYGSLDNIVVKDNYKDLLKQLGTYDQQYKNFMAYNDVKGKLGNMELGDEDVKKLYKKQSDLIPDWETNEEITKSEPYMKWQQGSDSGPGKTQDTFLNYVMKNHPEYALDLHDKGMIQDKVTEPTPEEVQQYKLGKLTPEERQLHDKYEKNPIKPGEHNKICRTSY